MEQSNSNRTALSCYYCGCVWDPANKNRRPTRDHKIPTARRSESKEFGQLYNRNDNVVWACFKCNQTKGTLTAEEYFAVLEYRRQQAKKEAEQWAIVHIPSELQNLTYEDHMFLYKAGVSCE